MKPERRIAYAKEPRESIHPVRCKWRIVQVARQFQLG